MQSLQTFFNHLKTKEFEQPATGKAVLSAEACQIGNTSRESQVTAGRIRESQSNKSPSMLTSNSQFVPGSESSRLLQRSDSLLLQGSVALACPVLKSDYTMQAIQMLSLEQYRGVASRKYLLEGVGYKGGAGSVRGPTVLGSA